MLAREKAGNVVRYSIRLPFVFNLCAFVCGSLRDEALERAKLLS